MAYQLLNNMYFLYVKYLWGTGNRDLPKFTVSYLEQELYHKLKNFTRVSPEFYQNSPGILPKSAIFLLEVYREQPDVYREEPGSSPWGTKVYRDQPEVYREPPEVSQEQPVVYSDKLGCLPWATETYHQKPKISGGEKLVTSGKPPEGMASNWSGRKSFLNHFFYHIFFFIFFF